MIARLACNSLLLNTGVSFPIAFSSATIHGFEGKLELRRAGPFTGYVSYSNMLGIGYLPVAGGLFLGDDADQLTGAGSFPISQDQRNTVRSQLRYQPHPRFWFAMGGSYNSGLPFENNGPANLDFIGIGRGRLAVLLRQARCDFGRTLDIAMAGVARYDARSAEIGLVD